MYNKHEIMVNAWHIRRTANVSMSVALKAAWALAKAIKTADTVGEESGWNHKTVANDWVKYGKHRTYVSTRIYTNAWSLKREIKLGYVDNLTGEYVAA